ncbi:hypothetical protein [Desulforhopalus vacuolatus]|nr:hypothetical protein [Desulforhopalus vacuolatus]
MKSRFEGLENMSEKQLPIAEGKLYGWIHQRCCISTVITPW